MATEGQDFETLHIPLSEIYCDAEFNCRGFIPPHTVAELAKSINDEGLQSAIIVQPASDVKGGLPEGYKYRIIAGHRRYTACKVLKWEKIRCTIMPHLDEVEATVRNLTENFQRVDLNMLQEAKALEHLHRLGVSQVDAAKRIKKSRSWVQIRYNLLELPREIQEMTAAGLVNQDQVKQLYSLPSDELRFEACKKIADAKAKGVNDVYVCKRQKKPLNTKKPRRREEIFEMIELIAKSTIGYCLATRALGWASGEVTTEDIFIELKREDPEIELPSEW